MSISMKNAQVENNAGCSISDLDVDDLLDEEIAQDLRHDGAANEIFAIGIFGHSLQIAGGHKEQGDHGGDRHQGEDGGGEAAVGAGGFDLALQAETFADNVGFGGVVRISGDKYTTLIDNATVGGDVVSSLLVDRHDNLWVAGSLGLMLRTPDGHIRKFDTHDGLPDLYVRVVLEDRDGNIWIGTNGGLARFQGDR